MPKRIQNKNLSTNDYLSFNKSIISKDGKNITFQYANGATYDVPVKYFLQWHEQPHYLVRDGRSVEWCKGANVNKKKRKVKFVKCRRIMKGAVVRVYMSDSTAYDVPWDTVLMACEPDYEEFGGWTEKGKKITYRWHKMKR